MATVVAGQQLYLLSYEMFDDLPLYSDDVKESYFNEIALSAITDKKGNPRPFRPIETITALRTTVLPFWLTKIAAGEFNLQPDCGPRALPMPLFSLELNSLSGISAVVEELGEMSEVALARSLYNAFMQINAKKITEVKYMATINNLVENGYEDFDRLACMIIHQYGTPADKAIADAHLAWLEASKKTQSSFQTFSAVQEPKSEQAPKKDGERHT